MKSSRFVLAALLVSGLGLAALAGGCVSTANQPSSSEYVDDSAITMKVKSAFMQDPMVKVLDLSVETFKGVVQLSGFVASAEEKAQAGRAAAGIAGVSSVKNHIIVK
jgi:osmotically-inducible protein OsmY